ncbi:TolC family outer membrane protein [Thiopseudomonas denitrificans]|uniref:Outer membrane protein n=1 Tax=Thiopseudomonas denitrificans TaxID=1501432 RepID=A0A4R6TWX8_9GAMM|nr:TolC family outer membrane protein [Thiopseudomonas denitrificans]TDQ36509.1 outer membrane protein [Thiopseudomonas denitrificans]
MKQKKGRWLILWAWGVVCVADPVQADDLMEIYRLALRHDAQYAASLAQRRVGDEQPIQGRAGLLPQISFDAQTSWSETEYKVVTGTVEQRRQNRSYGVQLVQPLFRWQNWIQYKQGQQQKLLADLQAESAGQALILRVTEAYFNVLNMVDVIDALEQLQAADELQLASARKNFDLGNASIVDVHEAQMSHDRTIAQLVKAKSALVLAKQALTQLTGRHPGSLKRLGNRVMLSPPEPTDVETWVTAAERGNLEVQAQELSLQITDNDVRSRKAEHLPTIDMVVSQSMQQSPNASTERSESAAIGIRLNIPLFSGGRTTSSTREALALREQAKYELEDTRRSTALAAREAWAGVMDGIAQLKALETAQSSADAAVRSNQKGYQLGMRTSADVLEVQSQLSDIVQQLAKVRYDILLAKLQLKATVGSLTPQDLNEINMLFE